jgi:hypothetical protein
MCVSLSVAEMNGLLGADANGPGKDGCRDTDGMSGAFRLGDLTVSSEADAGAWIVENTHDWGVVCQLVPDGFEGYARVFHPAHRWVEEAEDAGQLAPTKGRFIPGTNRTESVYGREVRWAEVAEANGRVAHPAMEWASVTGDYGFRWGGEQPGLWDRAPSMGSLSLRETMRLCELLAAHTATPGTCWFAIWEGYGSLPGGLRELGAPRLHMSGREMILLTGPLGALPATSFDAPWYEPGWANPADRYRSPSLWWPEDRSWCVASDVDLQTSYLGATAECVQHLIDDGELEILPVSPDQSVTIHADTINPEPSGVPS